MRIVPSWLSTKVQPAEGRPGPSDYNDDADDDADKMMMMIWWDDDDDDDVEEQMIGNWRGGAKGLLRGAREESVDGTIIISFS